MGDVELPEGFEANEPFISLSLTPDENINADDKETAVWVLKTMFDGSIRVPDLENSKFSNQILYKYWDGVAEAEQDIFGVEDWVCDTCSEPFDDRDEYVTHTNNCGSSTERSHERARELLDGETIEGEYIVYELVIEHECESEFYHYIGMTQDIHCRLSHHIQKRKSGIYIPHGYESLRECTNYTVYGASIVAQTDDETKARTIEMFYPYELCLKKNTTKILGGR